MALGASPLAITHIIKLDWDPDTKTIIVPTQPTMNVGENVTVAGAYGKKATIKFLSPFGQPIATVHDGEVFTLVVGGIYQFECFLDGQKAKYGGGVEILPHKP
jgi:hypothetical protein